MNKDETHSHVEHRNLKDIEEIIKVHKDNKREYFGLNKRNYII